MPGNNMQTPKTRSGSSEVPRKTSPSTPKSNRLSKPAGSVSDSVTSGSFSSKNPTDGSPRVIQRRSPRSPILEKKRPSKLMELESQLTQLQEDLRKTKDRLSTSESGKKLAQQEAEEAKKQVAVMSAKAEDSQRQLVELSAAEEARLEEFCKIAQDRDQAWQSELEAIRKQHSDDSVALATATNEIQRLTMQLETVLESEAAQAKQSKVAESELHNLKLEMAEKDSIIKGLKFQLQGSEKARSEAQYMLNESQKDLEISKTAGDTFCSDEMKLMESLNCTTLELDESRARVRSPQEIVRPLQADQCTMDDSEDGNSKHPMQKICHCPFDSHVEQLRSELETCEIKYFEEQIISIFQLQSAYEFMECLRTGSELRGAKLESALKDREAEIDDLKAKLTDKEAEFQNTSDVNEQLNLEVEKNRLNLIESELHLAELKLDLINKETALHSISEENELLKLEMEKKEMENHKKYEVAITELELARAGEQEALLRMGYVSEEADKNSRRAARVAEQLEEVQEANSEMEAELRRLRVQSDQWRKAAEAAAAILTTSNNGKLVERTGSLDSEYYSVRKLMSSPYSDDMYDESPKKKSSNVLRRIGGLWRKSQK